eukprot:11323920-Alexandrium_andersonii.AAC.1
MTPGGASAPLAGQPPSGENRAARAAACPPALRAAALCGIAAQRARGAGSAENLAEAVGRGPGGVPCAWGGRPG